MALILQINRMFLGLQLLAVRKRLLTHALGTVTFSFLDNNLHINGIVVCIIAVTDINSVWLLSPLLLGI